MAEHKCRCRTRSNLLLTQTVDELYKYVNSERRDTASEDRTHG